MVSRSGECPESGQQQSAKTSCGRRTCSKWNWKSVHSRQRSRYVLAFTLCSLFSILEQSCKWGGKTSFAFSFRFSYSRSLITLYLLRRRKWSGTGKKIWKSMTRLARWVVLSALSVANDILCREIHRCYGLLDKQITSLKKLKRVCRLLLSAADREGVARRWKSTGRMWPTGQTWSACMSQATTPPHNQREEGEWCNHVCSANWFVSVRKRE